MNLLESYSSLAVTNDDGSAVGGRVVKSIDDTSALGCRVGDSWVIDGGVGGTDVLPDALGDLLARGARTGKANKSESADGLLLNFSTVLCKCNKNIELTLLICFLYTN